MPPSDLDYLSKDDIFTVLASMKITIPPTSKLSLEILSKRLRDALNTSQRLADLLGEEDLDPQKHSVWGDIALMNQVGVMQQSVKDNFERMAAQGVPKSPEQLRGQTMQQMQDLALWLAYHFSDGHRNLFVSDPAIDDWAIAIRIHGVYAINEETPVFVVSYRTVTSIPNKTLQQQLNEVLPQPCFGQKAQELTRRTFLRLLNMNSKKVVAGYEPDGAENKKFVKKKWKLSFVLPLGPLPMSKVGKFAEEVGCDVCGSTANANRCTQCLSAVYCSAECQKSDWRNHKDFCQSTGGGTWTTINLGENATPPGSGGLPAFMQAMNFGESWAGNSMSSNAARVGGGIRNVHGDKAFLVKFQTSLMGRSRPDHMLMYDRQRSFTVAWKRSGDEDAFLAGEAALASEPIPLKMYRWAKFTGPNTMSVCFDRAPQTPPPW